MDRADDKRPKGKPDLPEPTLRIMERMLKTPPKPHSDKLDKGAPPDKKRPRSGSRGERDG